MRIIFKSIVFIAFFSTSNLTFAGSYEDFFKAIVQDQPAKVSALLERGFDPNTINPEGFHGLFLAVKADALQVANVLIQWPKTKVEWRNSKDESPLMMASLKGHTELVKLLIAKDADVNKTGWTALHYAASGAKKNTIEILLEHSAYIDAESPNGSTPLMMAAMYGNADCVRLLLESGADPTLKNHLGLTAAEFAKQAGRDDSLMMIGAAVIKWHLPKPVQTR
jgi:ankyrin repeat protein